MIEERHPGWHALAFGQLCRLLTLGKRRTVKGSCDLSLEDVLDYGAECILIALASALWFGETFSMKEIIGGGLIVAGTAIAWI